MSNQKNGQRKSVEHGTLSGYQHYKCRCNACKTAKKTYEKNLKKNGQKLPFVGPIKPKHGTFKAYSYEKCRCEICSAFMRGYREGLKYRSYRSDQEIVEAKSDNNFETNKEVINKCGSAAAYSFGCTCDLCLTQGRDAYLNEVTGGAV